MAGTTISPTPTGNQELQQMANAQAAHVNALTAQLDNQTGKNGTTL